MHNLVIKSLMYRIQKVTCNLWVSVWLGKLPMVQRTFFCRHCNFVREVSAMNSQVGRHSSL